MTGASGLLGSVFTKALYDKGATVIAADINYLKSKELSRKIDPSRVIPAKLDVTDKKSVSNLIKKISNKFGRIDVLINAAYRHISTPFNERKLKDFEDILRINLTGVFLCSQLTANYMESQGFGNIINIGSMYGVVSADPRIYGNSGLRSPEVYAASKGGVIQLTKYLAVHLANSNIRVNCLSPGGVYNKQNKDFLKKFVQKVPLKRMAKPEEIANALIFLASDASSYMTGHNLVVDGGFTIW